MPSLREFCLSWALEERGVLEEVDVEVDGAVEDGEEMREVGDTLHPLGPVQPIVLVAQPVMHLQKEILFLTFRHLRLWPE